MEKNNKKAPEIPEFDFVEPKEDDLILQTDPNFLKFSTNKVLASDGESVLKLIKRGFTGTEAAQIIVAAQYDPMIETLNEGLECVQAFGSGEIKIPQDVQEAYKSQETAKLNAQIQKVQTYIRNLTKHAEQVYADLNVKDFAEFKDAESAESFFDENLAGDIYQKDKQMLATLLGQGKTIKEAAVSVYNELYAETEQTLNDRIKEANATVRKYRKRVPSDQNQLLIEQATNEVADLKNQKERLRFYKKEIELYATMFYKTHRQEQEALGVLGTTTPEEDEKNVQDFLAFEGKRKGAHPASQEELDALLQKLTANGYETEDQSFEEEDEKDPYRYVFTQRELRTLAAAGLKRRKTIENYVNAIGGYDADFVETPKGYGMIKGALAMIHQAEDELDKEEEEARKEQEAFYEALHQVYAEKKPEDDDNEKA